MMIEDYPTLFDVPKMKLKGVMEELSVLNLENAKNKIDLLILLYPENDEIEREAKIIELIESVIKEGTTPASLFSGFTSFKKHLESITYLPDYMEELEQSFFRRIVDSFEGETIKSIHGYPVGFFLTKAGRYEEAAESLFAELGDSSQPQKKRARLMGYLGDLFYVSGDTELGRSFYLEAILADWRGIDKKTVADEDVLALIIGTYIPEGMGGIWAAPVGHMLLVFGSKSFEDSGDLMDFYKEFERLKSAVEKDKSVEIIGKLFYYALVIEENEDVFRSLKGTKKMSLRKLMRDLNPKLFKLHTKLSLSRKGANVGMEEKGAG